MTPLLRLLSALLVTVLLASCATGGPPKRIWPPQASLQELAVQADGSWRLALRLHNHSTVPMRFERVELELRVAGGLPSAVTATPGLVISPGSAEIVVVRVEPDFDSAGLVADALQTRAGVRYRLDGRITTRDPGGNHRSEFESVLSAVPGLDGVLR